MDSWQAHIYIHTNFFHYSRYDNVINLFTISRSPIQRVRPGTYEYVRLNLMLGSVIHDVSVDEIPCVIRTLDHS